MGPFRGIWGCIVLCRVIWGGIQASTGFYRARKGCKVKYCGI